MNQTSVILQFRETGMQTPVELVNGRVLGYTSRPPGARYYQFSMTVEQFNELSPQIFTARFAPGHEPIPQVVITEVPDPVQPTEDEKLELLKQQAAKLTEQEFAAGAALAMEGKPLPDHASPAAKDGHASMKATIKSEADATPAEFAAQPTPEPEPLKTPEPVAPNDPAPVQPAEVAANHQENENKLGELIAGKLAEKGHRLADLASAIDVPEQVLRDYIESEGSPYFVGPGSWVKTKAAQ